MALSLEILSTKFDLCHMLLSIQVFAHIHDRVQVVPLAIDIDCLLMLAGLDVKISSFFPVITVAFEFSLFYQNRGVEKGTLAVSSLTVFSDQLVGFIELFQVRVQGDCFVKHLVLYVVAGCLLVLALECKNFALKPGFV